MENRQKKALYSQIAAAAGVSLATVSRVINNRSIVRPETARKVLAAMEGFGYDTGEILAESKKAGGELILINLPTLGNPFYNEIVKGAIAAAGRHNYNIAIGVNHLSREQVPRFLTYVHSLKAAGLITLNQIDVKSLNQIQDAIPLVQCCEYEEDANTTFVSIDDVATSLALMKHVISTGKRRIALVNGPRRYKYARKRQEGYLTALRDAGLEADPNLIIDMPEIDYSMAVQAITQLLSMPGAPEAIYAVSDVYAAAAVRAAANLGLSVPKDLVVVGFDNVEISQTTSPTITTVNQPKFQLGFTACELLVEKIERPGTPIRRTFLDTELVIRESSL